MKNKSKIVSINFKENDKDLYNWVKKYCSENDNSFSRLIRDLLRQFRKNEEMNNE